MRHAQSIIDMSVKDVSFKGGKAIRKYTCMQRLTTSKKVKRIKKNDKNDLLI